MFLEKITSSFIGTEVSSNARWRFFPRGVGYYLINEMWKRVIKYIALLRFIQILKCKQSPKRITVISTNDYFLSQFLSGKRQLFLGLKIDRLYMTSRRPCWSTRTKKCRPCWCPKLIPWEFSSLKKMFYYFTNHAWLAVTCVQNTYIAYYLTTTKQSDKLHADCICLHLPSTKV